VKCAAITKRERYPAGTADFAVVRKFGSGKEAEQGRFTDTIRAENADIAT
jgi:hypothetical protein